MIREEMKTYNSMDAMVKDLGSEKFYRDWKKPSWHKFKNWCGMWYIIIKYRINCLIYGDIPIVVDDEMAETLQSIIDKVEKRRIINEKSIRSWSL